METNELILVTGATGYIAGRLIPRLLERGYRVRCLVRDPARLTGRSWFPEVEVFAGDLMFHEALNKSMQGVSRAYYLVHSMASGRNYAEQDLQAARNFGKMTLEAGIPQIIYLGGLADPEAKISPHMRSRIQTGEVLRASGVPVTEFRAGVIVGPGSNSFEMIRFLTEQFPVLVSPHWMRNRCQPIAAQNVLDYLLAALEIPEARGGIFEIGGPEVMSYADTMLTYARLRGLRRWLLILPLAPVGLMTYVVDKLTPVPASTANPLIESLNGHSVVRDDSARQVFPHVKLIDYQSAVRDTLQQLTPAQVEPIRNDAEHPSMVMKREGFFIDHRQRRLAVPPDVVYRAITECDLIVLRSSLCEALEPDCMLRLHCKRKVPGEAWIEWRVKPEAEGSLLTQTAFFAPKGLPGFMYWYLVQPLRAWVFAGLIGKIAKRARILNE